MASQSKYEFYDSGEHDILHTPGESASGTLIVGKVVDAKKIDSQSGSSINKRVWKSSEIQSFFVALPPSEVCPINLPETKRVVEQVKCCDVIPYRGICLVPQTIPIVKLSK